MCFVAPLLSGVLSAVGGMITAGEQQANAERMAEARNAELRRTLTKNDAIAKQARDTFDTQRKTMDAPQAEQNQQAATEERTQTIADAVKPADASSIPLSGSAPSVVRSEYAKKLGEAMDRGKANAQALGKLGGYGDYWLNQGFGNAQAGRDVGIQQNFAAGNMALLPYAQDFAAQRAYQPVSPIGGILAGFGKAFGSGGGGGFFAPSYTSPL